MVIDSLFTYTKPLEYQLTLQKPDGTDLVILPEAYKIEFSCSLKETNTLSFSVPYYVDGAVNDNFALIRTGYRIYMKLWSAETETYFNENIFKITEVVNSKDDSGVTIKEVSCESVEIELKNKILRDFTGSKVLYRTPAEISAWSASTTYPTLQSFIDSGVLNVITALCPSWTVDEIDTDIAALYRYFEVDSTACLDFLLGEVANAFLCVFFFDTINKKISAKNLTHLGTFRGFFLSDSTFVRDHTETINDQDVVTRLYMYGADGLNFRSVNVTGEDYILDLSYYRNLTYMSQSLLDALDTYDALLVTKQGVFAGYLVSLNSYTASLAIKNSELTILEAELEALLTARDELIEEGGSLTAINASITAKEGQITTKQGEITTLNGNIATVTGNIETLQSEILMENNFTVAQIEELDQFIRDKETTDDSFTDAQELYEEAVTILGRVNQPSVSFDINIVDIFSIVECQLDWELLSIGDIGAIKFDEFSTDVQLRLIGYTHDYETNSLSLTFGNRNNLNDTSMIAEQIKSTISTTTTMDIQKYKYLDYLNSGDKSAINSYITDILNLAAQGATAGSNNEVSIDGRGITLTNPAYPLKQVRLMYDGVYFTTDGWQTSSIALNSTNGVNAQIIRGILGEFVTLYANQITVGAGGEKISDDVIASAEVWDDAAADAIQALSDSATALEVADGQIQGFFQTTAPSTGMYFGDIWIDTDGHTPPTTSDIYRYEDASHGSQGTLAWRTTPTNAIGKVYLDAYNAQTIANGKRRVFTVTPTVPYDVGDLWAGLTSAALKVCTTAKTISGSYSSSDWVLASDAVSQSGTYNSVQINSTVGVKASHSDGSYSQMDGDGFLRVISLPTYTSSPTGVPNQETFATAPTGWEYWGTTSVSGGYLILGVSGSTTDYGSARVYQEITADGASFSVTYYTQTAGDKFYIQANDTIYTIPASTTETTFTTTLDKGLYCFQFDAQAYVHINTVVFESNPVVYTESGTSTQTNTYNYITYVGSGSTIASNVGKLATFTYDTAPPAPVWVQLPDEFKGKTFKIFTFVQDTGIESGRLIRKFVCEVVADSIDYTNAQFMVNANITQSYIKVRTSGSTTIDYYDYYRGCDFVYIAQY